MTGGATATHYEVLGVRPDASHDEIKQAYLDLALKHHPDRQADSSPDARRRAEHRMQEVNAAWEVLRSPGRRAAYDAQLRGVTPVWEARTKAPRTSAVQPGSVAGSAPRGPAPPGLEVPAPVPFARFGAIIVVLLVVVGIVVFTAYAASQDASEQVQVETTPAYPPGSCVQLQSIRGRVTPVVVACDVPGAYGVETVTDLGRPCPRSTTEFDVQDEKLRLCLDPPGP